LFSRAKQRIHLIGIGGSGLSAIARLLLESGYIVTGSDRSLSPLARDLQAAGARISIGHSAENVQGADVVVRSSAVPDDNVEVVAALQAGIPVLKRSQFLGQLMDKKLGLAVAGTGGKTTTSAMLAWMLVQLNLDPSYIIGGTVKDLSGSNAHAGKGNYFVIEADEYDRMFLGLSPDVIIVTYMEHDHPDCFPTEKDYTAAFEEFVGRLRRGGVLLVSYDNVQARSLSASAPRDTLALTFGTHAAADYSAENLAPNQRGGFDYNAYWKDDKGQKLFLAHLSLQAPGEHNVRNSLAALAAVHQVLPPAGLDDNMRSAAQALGRFSGTGRRFDVLGDVDGITVIDDYAHHPTKIKATLAAARARYPQRRIWAVWQPHTYSRTRALLDDFASSFENADRVLVTDVYAAREEASDFDNFSAAQVVEHMSHPGARFLPTLDENISYLLQNLQPGDVLLVLSAGDADQISARVMSGLQQRSGKHA